MPRATAVSRKEQWSDWSSGRHLLARVRQNGCWSDGLPLGRGHGQPYLQPAYARALDLRKSVEGRPLEGWVVHVAAGDAAAVHKKKPHTRLLALLALSWACLPEPQTRSCTCARPPSQL